MNYSNNDEVNDEIEACLSVYDLLEVSKGDNDSITISLHCFPRTAESTSLSFVSLKILIILSKDYPIKHPLIKITNSCGLSDEGKSINIGINDLISTLIPGDPILFKIFEYIIDSLDESNGGECLICTDTLIPNSSNKLEKSVPIEEYSLCTPCSHTFHVSCLTKWGAICLETKELGKEAKAAKVIDDVKIRTLEGEVRGNLTEIEKWKLIIVKLEEENEKYNNILNSKNEIEKNNSINKNTPLITSKIPTLRAKLSTLIQKESKTKDKISLQYELKLIQQEIQKEELIESENLNNELNNENSDIERLIASTTFAINEALIKLEREEKRYKICLEKLKIAEISTLNKKESSMLNREFPCPCCRQLLLENNCLSSSRKKNLFSTLLDNAINEKEDNDKNSIENYSNNNSVLLLPIKLIDIVRQIQQQQEQVFKSLKSNKSPLNGENVDHSDKIIEMLDNNISNNNNNEKIENNNSKIGKKNKKKK